MTRKNRRIIKKLIKKVCSGMSTEGETKQSIETKVRIALVDEIYKSFPYKVALESSVSTYLDDQDGSLTINVFV